MHFPTYASILSNYQTIADQVGVAVEKLTSLNSCNSIVCHSTNSEIESCCCSTSACGRISNCYCSISTSQSGCCSKSPNDKPEPGCSQVKECEKNSKSNGNQTTCQKDVKSSIQLEECNSNKPGCDASDAKDKKSCFCSETRKIKHVHGPNCGHEMIFHNGHVDFIVESLLHFPHGEHCDNHGTIKMLVSQGEEFEVKYE